MTMIAIQTNLRQNSSKRISLNDETKKRKMIKKAKHRMPLWRPPGFRLDGPCTSNALFDTPTLSCYYLLLLSDGNVTIGVKL
jgi:hypothetical protein